MFRLCIYDRRSCEYSSFPSGDVPCVIDVGEPRRVFEVWVLSSDDLAPWVPAGLFGLALGGLKIVTIPAAAAELPGLLLVFGFP